MLFFGLPWSSCQCSKILYPKPGRVFFYFLSVSESIFSINIPYPRVGSLTNTWVTAPTSFPSWMMGEPLTSVANRGQQFFQKLTFHLLFIQIQKRIIFRLYEKSLIETHHFFNNIKLLSGCVIVPLFLFVSTAAYSGGVVIFCDSML